MTDHSKKKVEDLKKVLEGRKKTTDQGLGTRDQGLGEETPPELQALQEKIETAQEEARQNYDKLLRVMAEFENYKKRVARDHEDRVQYGLEHFIKELIPVLDDFDRVLEHLPQESSPAIQSLIDGVQLTQRHFLSALKKLNLHEMETKGQTFDPHLHEAINQVESSDHQAGEIVTCHRKGYLLHDRLLRPAMVTVAKNKENDAP